MAGMRRVLGTLLTVLGVAAVVGTALPAQAQGRAPTKRFSLKKAGPKTGAGKAYQGTRAPGASGGGMTSGSGGMTSQSKGSSSSTKSGSNLSGSSMTSRPTNRGRK